ncbi:MAG TPA: hypothetical protein VF432_02060 [Thermoanaerobaculia bacterium]
MHPLLILLLFIQTTGPAMNGNKPEALWAKGSRFPLFVSASAAVDDDGVPNPSLFDEASRDFLRMEIERRRGDARRRAGVRTHAGEPEACDTMIVSPHAWWSVRARPWEEIVASSRATVRGTVVGTTAGFQHLAPVTLISIRIEEPQGSPVPFPRSGLIHVVYPAADFRAGGARFCRVHGSGFVPRDGDEVLVLVADSPSDDSGSLVTPLEVVFSRGGRLIVPESVSDRDRLLTYESFDALFRSLAHR